MNFMHIVTETRAATGTRVPIVYLGNKLPG